MPHHRGSTGLALLDGALTTIECRTTDMHPTGDHSIVVGEVVSRRFVEHQSGVPLTYYRSRFGTLACHPWRE